MKISVLCVTEDRPAFMPWLLWNFKRLDWPDKELVIVDSSERPFACKQKNVRVIPAPGRSVPAKRNIALTEASGDFVTWLDDDDWRHPNFVKELLPKAAPVAGGRTAWFVNPLAKAGEHDARYFVQRGGWVLFAAVLVATAVARAYPFDEEIERGSDLDWMGRLLADYTADFSYEVPALFLCHKNNMGNTNFIHHFNLPLTDAQAQIGAAWGDTSEQLEKLRERLIGT